MALLTGQPSPEAMRNVRAGARRARMGLGQVFGGDPNRFLTNQERAQDQLQGLMNRPADLSSVEGYTNFLKLQLQANPQNQAAILQAGLPSLRTLRQEEAARQLKEQQQREEATRRTTLSTFFRNSNNPKLQSLADIATTGALQGNETLVLQAITQDDDNSVDISSLKNIQIFNPDGSSERRIAALVKQGDKESFMIFGQDAQGNTTYTPVPDNAVLSETGDTTNININDQAANLEALGKENAKAVVETLTKNKNVNNDKVAILESLDRQIKLLDEGIITGTGANVQTAIAGLLAKTGFISSNTVEATQTFIANAAELTANEIKAFGAGTGLSDADREFALNMVAGNIALTEGALRRILKIRAQIARSQIERNNAQFDKLKENEQQVLNRGFYTTPIPEYNWIPRIDDPKKEKFESSDAYTIKKGGQIKEDMTVREGDVFRDQDTNELKYFYPTLDPTGAKRFYTRQELRDMDVVFIPVASPKD
tara:strand:- start:2881 stop:4332 length:1452 start_codon:yes stop_codon:yes gene_type:complete